MAPHRRRQRIRVRRGNEDDAARMRQSLLDAAKALFSEGGLEAVAVRSIAERCGVSAMTPYRYFPSKAAFLRALWNGVFAALDANRRQALSGVSEPRARHRQFIDATVAFWENHPAEFGLVVRTQGMQSTMDANRGEPAPEYRSLLASGYEMTAELAQALGVGPERVKLATDLRIAMLFGYLQAALVNGRYPWSDLPAMRRAYVDATVDAVERCLLGEAVAAKPLRTRKPAHQTTTGSGSSRMPKRP